MEHIPTEPPRRRVTIHDLLRHTSGFSYGAFSNTVVDSIYRERDILYQPTLEDLVDELSEIPWSTNPERGGTTASPRTCSADS